MNDDDLDTAFDNLSEDTATAYLRYSQWPGPHLTAATASALLGKPIGRARVELTKLVTGEFMTKAGPDHWRWRPEVHRHAEMMADRRDTEPERERALARALERTLQAAAAADYALFPQRARLGRAFNAAALEPPAHPSEATASGYLTIELENIVAAQDAAVGLDRFDLGWQLGETLWTLLQTHRPHPLWENVAETAATCARDCGDRAAEARMLSLLAQAQRDRGDGEAAWQTVREMLALTAASGDRMGMVTSLEHSGALHLEQDAPQDACDSLEKALTILDEIGGRDRARALIHRWLGTAYAALNRHDDADTSFTTAYDLFGGLHLGADFHQQGRIRTEHAHTLLRAGAPRAAVAMLDQAVTILADCNRPFSLAHAHRLLGQAYLTLGEIAAAHLHAAKAVRLYESTRISPDHEHHRRALELTAQLEATGQAR